MTENEYGIKTNIAYPSNPQADAIIYRINQVLRNRVKTYNPQKTCIYVAEPWMGVLAAADFVVIYTLNRNKGKFPGHIVFGRDMILPINHVADWRYIS